MALPAMRRVDQHRNLATPAAIRTLVQRLMAQIKFKQTGDE